MKAEAIVYESNTGFTKRYAELLSEATGLASYEQKSAGMKLRKGADVIYMGWMLAGGVKGYKKASRKYRITALAGVGMGSPTEKAVNDIVKKYNISGLPVFYLQGGYDKSRLHGIYKLMMNNMEKIMANSINKKEQKTDEELLMLDVVKNGRDFVKAENLASIVSWIK